MSDNTSNRLSYPEKEAPTDPFARQGSSPWQNPFQNRGPIKSHPFGQAYPLANRPPKQGPAHAGDPGTIQEHFNQFSAVGSEPIVTPQQNSAPIAPPLTFGNFEQAKPNAGEKKILSTLSSHVYHDNLTISASQPTENGYKVKNTEREILESIKPMNTSSHFVKTTVSILPSSTTLRQKTNIPLGFIIRPLAPLPEGEPEVPLINHGTDSITRCTRCRAYINPFVTFEASRRFWICNLCGVSNETPFRYLNVPGNGYTEDLPPELKTGVVEYVASADYMVRPPQAPTIMFVIDVSAAAINSGMVEVVCKTISDIIISGSLPGGSRTLVGIVTFDTSVHFYQMPNGIDSLQIMVVSDLEDLFLPFPGEIFLNVSESSEEILHLLSILPTTWINTMTAGSCMGSALRVAHFAMKHIGGKMCVFTASPSCFGDFSLSANSGTQNAKGNPNLQPVEKCKDYSNMICQTQVSLELFVCTPQCVNLASTYHLAAQTAGYIHYFPFKSHYGNIKLSEELKRVLTRHTGWEAVMRIRVTKGWKITNWFGHCYIRGSDLMVLPNCHSDQVFTVTFGHEENVVLKRVAYFQTALLHTTSSGERRIRVSTFAIPVSDNFSEIMTSMDPEATISTIAQLAITIGLDGKLSDARNLLQTLCSKIFSTMSSLNTSPELAGRLVMYTLGLLKSPCFTEGATQIDARIFHWMRLRSLPIQDIVAYCYPRLIPVHALPSEFALGGELNFEIPASLSLTHGNLSQNGAYLLENGEHMILWIGKEIPSEWLSEVFEVPSLDALNCDLAESSLLNSGSVTAIRLASVIKALRARRLPYMNLLVVRQGDEMELKFYSSLIEDKTPGMMLSLNEFMSTMTTRSPFQFKQQNS